MTLFVYLSKKQSEINTELLVNSMGLLIIWFPKHATHYCGYTHTKDVFGSLSHWNTILALVVNASQTIM